MTRHQLQPHSDIKPNYKGGYDFVNYDSNPMDDNNHGTHMAAIRDGRGVVEGASSDGGGRVKSVEVRLNDNTYATATPKLQETGRHGRLI